MLRDHHSPRLIFLAGSSTISAVLVVILLVLPGAVSASPTFSKTFRPPYTSGGQVNTLFSLVGFNCATKGVTSAADFNLTTGRMSVNATEMAMGCGPNASSGTYSVWSGVCCLAFSVSAAGYYNWSVTWSGPIWANLSVNRNGSPWATTYAGYNVSILSSLFLVKNRTVVSGQTHVLGNATIHTGTKNSKLASGKFGPMLSWLTPGHKYAIWTWISIDIFVHVPGGASSSTTAYSSVMAEPGVLLKSAQVS